MHEKGLQQAQVVNLCFWSVISFDMTGTREQDVIRLEVPNDLGTFNLWNSGLFT